MLYKKQCLRSRPLTCARALSLALVASAFVASAAHAGSNIVLDGNFSQATSSHVAPDWTFTPAPSGSDFIFSSTSGPNPGDGYAAFGANNRQNDSIVQTLSTIVGDNYTITYELGNQGGAPTGFNADFGGVTITSLSNPSPFSYRLFSATATASSSSTSLVFSGNNNPTFYYLSDVSVVDAGPAGISSTPEPSALATFALAGAGLLGLALRARKRAGLLA